MFGIDLCGFEPTPSVVLPVCDDLVYNFDVGISFSLRIANLFGVAAALGDEVVAVYPSLAVFVQYCCCCYKTGGNDG